jgi:non-specific protein-tyrosine kinase
VVQHIQASIQPEAVHKAHPGHDSVHGGAGEYGGGTTDRETSAGLQVPSDFDKPMARERVGWFSPAYTMSRALTLNPKTLEENGCIAFRPDSPEVEQYRVLRTRIMQQVNHDDGTTIMVTSALPGEGKTLTAINLAFTLAREFEKTVLLVDCDFRSQNIYKVMGYASDRGLGDYLMDECLLDELFVWPGVEKLTVISGGRTMKDGSELLGSPSMRNLVQEMKSRYKERIIIFDVPPVLAGADALVFAPLVDSIIVTVRAGQTPVQEVTKAIGMLPRSKVLGTVLNRHRGLLPSYGS